MANKVLKKLIVYYSLDGNTKAIAESIAKDIGADVLELKYKNQKIRKGFLKYFLLGMQVSLKIKPILLPFDKNPNSYDLVIIGTPVWAGSYASPYNTYFSKVRTKNKKVAIFCCYGGGEGNALTNLKKQLKNNEIIGEVSFQDMRYKNNNLTKEETITKAIEWARKIIKKI